MPPKRVGNDVYKTHNVPTYSDMLQIFHWVVELFGLLVLLATIVAVRTLNIERAEYVQWLDLQREMKSHPTLRSFGRLWAECLPAGEQTAYKC